jgi:protocatechuate 4,5-dioxygenase alpha chain
MPAPRTARHAWAMSQSGRISFEPLAPRELWGTTIFDGQAAQRGYALNKMCYSFNDAANREAFRQDQDGYCRRFGLDAEQFEAVRNRDVLALIRAGGNIYYLAKLAGIFGLNVQDLGAQQTGRSVEEFRALLRAAGD